MAISLVTGGAGFIGSHLVEALLARGDQVRVLDNFSTGRRENLSNLQGGLKIVEGDLRDGALVRDIVVGVDSIYHLAAMVSVPQSMDDPLFCASVNETGTLSLLEAARRNHVERVVMASSCAVYGDSEELPLKETSSLKPLSPYAVSKLTTEAYMKLYTHTFEIPVVALRFFNVYGPRQRPDSDYAAVIPIFIDRMLSGSAPVVHGDGTQKRDFVYVKDVVRAILLAAEVHQAAGNAYNVCTGQETQMLELLEVLSELIPMTSEHRFSSPRPGDIYRSVGDPGFAAGHLGFSSETPLLEGLAQTVNWMRK